MQIFSSGRKGALKVSAIVVLSAAIGFVVGSFIESRAMHNRKIALSKEFFTPTDKISTTMSLLEKSALDSISVDSIREEIMPLIIGKIDPHSSYIPAKDFKGVSEVMEGEFDGVGIVFNMATDTVIVLNVIASGPSAQAGVLTRDRIIKINDTLVAGQSVRQDLIVKKLRGPRGTKVKLTVERVGVNEPLEIEVTRDKIPLKSVEASLILEDSVGYVSLSQFSRTTYSEFIAAMNRLMKQGMRSLIIDLRGNSGGFMDQSTLIANEFLSKEALIVYMEDRAGKRTPQLASHDGQLQNLPVAVLIDESSASSSEILAGALQDNDKGVIVGRRSFGKGLVQRQIEFNDGSAIRLTSARYLTPTGRSIQKPYTLGDKESYERDIINRVMHEELFTADSIAFNDSLKFVTPKGRVVYGGGGIMPDIFVPLSRDELPKYFVDVVKKNILFRYTMVYSDKNRDALAKVETLEQLNAMLDADRTIMTDFVNYANLNGVSVDSASYKAAEPLLKRQLRAFIGRNTKLGDNGYVANHYPLDDTIMQAIEELKNPTMPQ